MWPFSDRRRNKRWIVDWEASLLCRFANADETVQVRVTEVSFRGVRLHLERMQVGSYHLVVSDMPTECELSILVPQGLFRSSIEFKWFNQHDAEGVFVAGAEFVDLGPEDKMTLKHAVKGL